MRQHQIDTYKEGWQRIEFCIICSAEGQELRLECVGILPSKDQLELFSQNTEKDIDTRKEQF